MPRRQLAAAASGLAILALATIAYQIATMFPNLQIAGANLRVW